MTVKRKRDESPVTTHVFDVKHVYDTNNASQLDVKNATSDCHRNCSKLRPHRSQQRRHRRTRDCRTRSNKRGVLAMSIRAVRSSIVASSVSHTSDFRWPQKKKFKRLRYWKRGD
ncbi:hypothetical protein TNCV_1834121 [Trichonephila clavipes]|nr:hypothetical protein TNCV_1834121 [Trichonephila clavipes]